MRGRLCRQGSCGDARALAGRVQNGAKDLRARSLPAGAPRAPSLRAAAHPPADRDASTRRRAAGDRRRGSPLGCRPAPAAANRSGRAAGSPAARAPRAPRARAPRERRASPDTSAIVVHGVNATNVGTSVRPIARSRAAARSKSARVCPFSSFASTASSSDSTAEVTNRQPVSRQHVQQRPRAAGCARS